MKKRYYYWMAAALVVIVIVALLVWYGLPGLRPQAERVIEEKKPAAKMGLRELKEEKDEEERFSESVRRLTGTEFDSLSADEQFSVLLQLADDPEALIRLLSVRRLAAIETADTARVVKLIEKLEDENLWVVEEAVRSLTKLGAASAIVPLRQLLARLQQQAKIEYVPFQNTEMIGVYGRMAPANDGAAAPEETPIDFTFELTSYPKITSRQAIRISEQDKIARFIPSHFELCVAAPSFKTYWQQLKSSSFAQKLVRLQAWADFKAAVPFNKYFELQENLEANLSPFGGGLVELLGDEVYVALYPADNRDHVLLVTPVNLKTKTVSTFLGAIENIEAGNVIIQKMRYRNQQVFHVSQKSGASLFHYSVVDDYLIVSSDQQLLVQAMRFYLDSDENSLAGLQSSWQLPSRRDDSTFLIVYVDPEKFFDLRKKLQLADDLEAEVRAALLQLGGELPRRPLESPPDSTGVLVAEQPALDSRALQFIPAEAIFCYATATIDPLAFWRYIATMRAQREAIMQFETRSNLNFERDLVERMDNQLVYFYAGIDTTGPRFFGRHFLAVRLHQPQGIEQYGRRLMRFLYSPADSVQVEEYEGEQIFYVQGPTTFQPNFAIVDDYLLMSLDLATLRAAIDAYRRRADSVAQNPRFVETLNRLDTPEQSVVYFDLDGFWDNYRSYLLRYDRQTNLFDETDLQTRIEPLFALFKATLNVGAGKFTAAGNGEILLRAVRR